MPCEEKATQIAKQDSRKLDLPEGVPRLRTLYLYASGACNLACHHCWISPTYQSGGSDGAQHIKLEYVRKAIRETGPLGLGSCVAHNFYATDRLNAPYQFCDRADVLGLFPASRKRQLTDPRPIPVALAGSVAVN
jgi:hypothetical protein